MAATVASIPSIDLKTSSSHPLRLGSSILKPAESRAYSTVRYNHKPKTNPSGEVSTSIKPSKTGNIELLLRNGDEEYAYTGKASDEAGSFVLFSRGGKDKELVLEKLSISHALNLTKTPAEPSASTLAEEYPHLPQEDEEDDLFGDDEDIEELVDTSNPFDFRNHLKVEPAKPTTNGADTPQSSAGTPRPTARATTSTSAVQPKKPAATTTAAQRKRKAQDPLKPNPKRVKAGTEPPAPTASTKFGSKPKAAAPSIRLDRKASVRRPSLDDSGELILENETPVTEKPSGHMALALTGQLGGGGPISLRSAASSPASHVASPAPARPEGMEEAEEFELGGDSGSENGGGKGRLRSPEGFGGGGEEDEDTDADVEDLELPSPRQGRRSVGEGGGGAGVADDDYDMERELELALAQEDDGVGVPSTVHESEEESEEE